MQIIVCDVASHKVESFLLKNSLIKEGSKGGNFTNCQSREETEWGGGGYTQLNKDQNRKGMSWLGLSS